MIDISTSQTGSPFVSSWLSKIRVSNKFFSNWETRFQCKLLDQYYEGFQWNMENEIGAGYVMNMIYSTWKTKQPALIFREPRVQFSPEPSGADFDPDGAFEKAKLATALVNTLIHSPNMEFADNCSMALLDTGPYFGMVEVGYSANWIRNPNAGTPEVNKDYDESVTKVKVEEPEEIPEEEWIYVKRIRPERVRIGGNNHWKLEKNAWVAYYEYHRPIDLSDLLKSGNSYPATDEYVNEDGSDPEGPQNNLHRIWKVWDLRSKNFFILDENENKVIYEPESFKRLPLKMLAFDRRRKGAYPMPLFRNWKTQQDDLNESMEQLRAHRRRSKRVYQVERGALQQEELDKFKSLPDGTIIEREPGPTKSIEVVPNAQADNSILQSVQISKDNLNIVSGVSSDIRGESDRVTATQASISAKAGSVREFSEREVVAKWLSEICLEILQLAMEKFSESVWVKLLVDDAESVGAEVPVISHRYELLSMEMLEGIGYRAHISVDSMSPITNEEEKGKLLEFFAILNQYPVISLHPTLIRTIAARLDFNDENVIQALQQMAMLQMLGAQSQMQQMFGPGAMGPKPTNMDQTTLEQMTPPNQAQIEDQLGASGIPQ